ncbi:acetyl-coenzyme A carboxylase carboxyl transferase subunit alpha, chloroplastic, partial [Tanacetum coccineum]
DLDNSTSNVLIPLDSWTSELLVYRFPLSGGHARFVKIFMLNIRKTTLTIVGYGHDAAALSPKPEEGGISQQLAWVWKAKMEQQVKAVTISSLPSPGFMEPHVGLMHCHNESDPYPIGALKDLYTYLTPIQRVNITQHPNRSVFLNHVFSITARYRKALRMIYYAHHHGFPIVTFIDTPRAFTDVKSEKLGQVYPAIPVFINNSCFYLIQVFIHHPCTDHRQPRYPPYQYGTKD